MDTEDDVWEGVLIDLKADTANMSISLLEYLELQGSTIPTTEVIQIVKAYQYKIDTNLETLIEQFREVHNINIDNINRLAYFNNVLRVKLREACR